MRIVANGWGGGAHICFQEEVAADDGSRGDSKLVGKLLKRGADGNSQDREGNTLMHLIYRNFNDCRSGDFAILDQLLNAG